MGFDSTSPNFLSSRDCFFHNIYYFVAVRPHCYAGAGVLLLPFELGWYKAPEVYWWIFIRENYSLFYVLYEKIRHSMYIKYLYGKEQTEQTHSQEDWQENREQDTGETIKEEVGEITTDSGGGWISWKMLVLRRDLNEQTESCWKSGGRRANLRKWYLRVSKECQGEHKWRKIWK